MKLNLNIPDFERYTSDQQFVNVVGALNRMETQKGGLTVEEIWGIAWQVVEMLKGASHPAVTAKILLTRISGEIEEKTKDLNRTKAQNIHSTHSVLFCVNYLLCANAEEPDPNQDVIDSISEQLSHVSGDRFLTCECVGRWVHGSNCHACTQIDKGSMQTHRPFFVIPTGFNNIA